MWTADLGSSRGDVAQPGDDGSDLLGYRMPFLIGGASEVEDDDLVAGKGGARLGAHALSLFSNTPPPAYYPDAHNADDLRFPARCCESGAAATGG